MIIRYFKEVGEELYKIRWIHVKEVISTSVAVFLIVMIFSSIFMIFDVISLEFVKRVFGF